VLEVKHLGTTRIGKANGLHTRALWKCTPSAVVRLPALSGRADRYPQSELGDDDATGSDGPETTAFRPAESLYSDTVNVVPLET
jgi:hypothetical protein